MAITAIIMDVTMNITADKKADLEGREKTADPSYRGGVVVLLLCAGLSLVLSLPRLIGGLHALGAGETVSALLSDGPPPAAAVLENAAADLAAAERWGGAAEYALDRGLILLRQGLAAPGEEKAAAFFAAAEQATIAGVTAAPGEPAAWARLAWLRHRRGDIQGALAALRLSWLSGAFVPAMMASRLEFALALHGATPYAMDDEMLSLLRRQIRLAWVVSPDFVAQLAVTPKVGAVVNEALAQLSEQDIQKYIQFHGDKK